MTRPAPARAPAWTQALDAAARDAVERSLEEDLAGGVDITTASAIAPEAAGAFVLRSREQGVVAGVRVAEVSCGMRGIAFTPACSDGDIVAPGETIGTVVGRIADVLVLERTILNLLGLLSGTATATALYVEAVRGAGAQPKICATRKTIPGLRRLQKYAVAVGGGDPHREGLSDAVLLKDNHRAGLTPAQLAERVVAVAAHARAASAPSFVCCEVDELRQLDALLALPAGVLDIVLLDNFSLADLRLATRARDGSRSTIQLEASGGVTLATVRAIAETGVDRISVGALTHSVKWLDVGLDDA